MFYYKNNFVLYTTRGIPSTLKIKKNPFIEKQASQM